MSSGSPIIRHVQDLPSTAELYVRARYREGWEILVNDEPLPLEEGVRYFLTESAKLGNKVIPQSVEWEMNWNRVVK